MTVKSGVISRITVLSCLLFSGQPVHSDEKADQVMAGYSAAFLLRDLTARLMMVEQGKEPGSRKISQLWMTSKFQSRYPGGGPNQVSYRFLVSPSRRGKGILMTERDGALVSLYETDVILKEAKLRPGSRWTDPFLDTRLTLSDLLPFEQISTKSHSYAGQEICPGFNHQRRFCHVIHSRGDGGASREKRWIDTERQVLWQLHRLNKRGDVAEVLQQRGFRRVGTAGDRCWVAMWRRIQRQDPNEKVLLQMTQFKSNTGVDEGWFDPLKIFLDRPHPLGRFSGWSGIRKELRGDWFD